MTDIRKTIEHLKELVKELEERAARVEKAKTERDALVGYLAHSVNFVLILVHITKTHAIGRVRIAKAHVTGAGSSGQSRKLLIPVKASSDNGDKKSMTSGRAGGM